MRVTLRWMLLLVLIGTSAAAAASPAVKAAATRYVGGIDWQEDSVLTGDFSCSGKRQNAILGTSDKEIVVAVFTQDLGKPPELLRFAGAPRKPAAARIRLEDSAWTKDEIQALSNTAPRGYRPSKSCKGVRLSGDSGEATHIYWDHEARRFDSWTQ